MTALQRILKWKDASNAQALSMYLHEYREALLKEEEDQFTDCWDHAYNSAYGWGDITNPEDYYKEISKD